MLKNIAAGVLVFLVGILLMIHCENPNGLGMLAFFLMLLGGLYAVQGPLDAFLKKYSSD